MKKPEGIETRVLPLELRVDGDPESPATVAGRWAVYDSWSENLGGFFERIEPGFFSDVLGDDVRFTLNHDHSFVFARTRSETLSLSDTDAGPTMSATVTRTQRNTDFLLDPLGRRDLSQMSFVFGVKRGGDRWEEDQDGTMRRTLLAGGASFLRDVSVVAFPAYADTTAAARSLNQWKAEHRGDYDPDLEALIEAQVALELESGGNLEGLL